MTSAHATLTRWSNARSGRLRPRAIQDPQWFRTTERYTLWHEVILAQGPGEAAMRKDWPDDSRRRAHAHQPCHDQTGHPQGGGGDSQRGSRAHPHRPLSC